MSLDSYTLLRNPHQLSRQKQYTSDLHMFNKLPVWCSCLSIWRIKPRAVSRKITHLHPSIVSANKIGLKIFFFFFFFAFPSYISGVHHFWVRFLRMRPFFNPTIKVVTFRLRGWCVLGVFLLPAFTRLGHERQDLLSPCDEMHVSTD